MSAKAAVSPPAGYPPRFEAEPRETLPLWLAVARWLLAAPQFLAPHLVGAVASVLIFIARFAILAPVRLPRASFLYLVAVGKWWIQPDASTSLPHDERSTPDARANARRAGGAIVALGALAIPIVAGIAALLLLLADQSTSQAQNHGNLGLDLYYKGELRDAIEEFDRAIQLNPRLASAYVARSAAYGDLGDSQLALDDATTAIDLDPTLAGAYVNRARAHLQLGITLTPWTMPTPP